MNPGLERLLKEDPMGKLFAASEKASQFFYDRLTQQYPHVVRALNEARESAETRAKLNFKDEEGRRRSAEILGISFEDLQSYFELHHSLVDELVARRKEAVGYSTLRRSGAALLHHSPVAKIKVEELPADSLKPYIVYWSADWCFPCQLTKPTFARLARFFDKCPLFFGEDNNFSRVKFVPQLVAYLPGGAQVGSDCGENTQELWEHLNLLITLGRNFQGNGELVCDEQGCRIDPVG